ncbi:hypothetical protein EZS27_024173 [termite gut metagenome]|uniref:Uncharacterized protein n=1 Tax=termite gut metagenome TaxID=433724 RepID=A0A5J4R193_9ZZZZ
MGATRNLYEKLIISFGELCKIAEPDTSTLDLFKTKLEQLINKIKDFYLFPLLLSDNFYDCLNRETVNFHEEQKLLSKELYICSGKLLFSFENTSRKIDYSWIIEFHRTELPFKQTLGWDIDEIIEAGDMLKSFFFSMNLKWLKIKTEKEYLIYRQKIRSIENKMLIGKHKDESIEFSVYKNVEKYFLESIQEYRDFIIGNYPSIKEEFSLCCYNIRAYLVPRKYNKENDIAIFINLYKNSEDNSVYLHPLYIDFAYRFSNYEEIKLKPLSASHSLFNEENPQKYSHAFSKQSIYHELNRIFVYKSDFQSQIDYLIYILRARLYSVKKTDENTTLVINIKGVEKKCKIFFDLIPNINTSVNN